MLQTWEIRKAQNILAGKPKRKGSLGRPRYRWEDDIKIEFKEIGWKGVD
jgi:hypothetical protein